MELNDRAYGFAWIEFPKFVCLFAGSKFLECSRWGFQSQLVNAPLILEGKQGDSLKALPNSFKY